MRHNLSDLYKRNASGHLKNFRDYGGLQSDLEAAAQSMVQWYLNGGKQ